MSILEGLTPLPRRALTRPSRPTKAPEQMKRMFVVSTTNVSPFAPDHDQPRMLINSMNAPDPPPPNPGSPSLTPFFPAEPAPKLLFIGLFGSHVGASSLTPADPMPDPEAGPELTGGFALSVTLVPSINRRKACWTPSPPTSRPPPQVANPSPAPRRASLSTSSIWMMPILRW